MKRAPDHVRYLGRFGEHILTRSFTARDPEETSNGTLIDHEVANVEDAQRIVTGSASSFVGGADRLASLAREKGEKTRDICHDSAASMISSRVRSC
jgi:hypothetical protein